jgi:hypothetical protein
MAGTTSTYVGGKDGLDVHPYDYDVSRIAKPPVRQQNIIYPNGGTLTTIFANTNTPFIFNIPQDVQNFYTSTVAGTYTLQCQAGLAGFIAHRPWLWNVQLTSTSGAQIINLPNLQEYVTHAQLRNISWTKYLQKQLLDHFGPSNVSKLSNQALTVIPTAIPNTVSMSVPGGVSVPASQLDVDFVAPLMIRSYPAGSTIITNFMWAWGDMWPDTLAGIDCMLWFPEILLLTINFASENTFCWSATNQGDATIGAAQLTTGAVGVLTNLRLVMDRETNLIRRQEVMDRCKARGFSMPIPMTQCFITAVPPGTTVFNNDLLLSAAMGSELRHVTWALWSGDRRYNGSMDCSNVEGQPVYGKIKDFQCKINGWVITPNRINCTPNMGGYTGIYQDYEIQKKFGGDIPWLRTYLTYAARWGWHEDFMNMKPVGEYVSVQRALICGGVILSGPGAAPQTVYNVNINLPTGAGGAGGLSFYQFATTTRTLTWGETALILT